LLVDVIFIHCYCGSFKKIPYVKRTSKPPFHPQWHLHTQNDPGLARMRRARLFRLQVDLLADGPGIWVTSHTAENPDISTCPTQILGFNHTSPKQKLSIYSSPRKNPHRCAIQNIIFSLTPQQNPPPAPCDRLDKALPLGSGKSQRRDVGA
jgi:hypothetical protein